MNPHPESADCAAEFKRAMRGVAGTVAIVTACDGGAPVGMAATSFCSVSMEPPSLLVCVNQNASVLRGIRESGGFCINILHSEKHSVCSYFGGKYTQEERFKFHAWSRTEEGLPYLADAQAVLVCSVAGEVRHGTHLVFLGNVAEVREPHPVGDPLIYLNGHYARAVDLCSSW